MKGPLTIGIAAFLATLASSQGVERWSIKTSVPAGSDLFHPRFVALKDLMSFAVPPGVVAHDPRYQAIKSNRPARRR